MPAGRCPAGDCGALASPCRAGAPGVPGGPWPAGDVTESAEPGLADGLRRLGRLTDGRLGPRARRGGADGLGGLTGPAPAGAGAAGAVWRAGAADGDCRTPAVADPGT